MVERILDGLFDDPRGLGGGETVLGLALEFRLAHEHREHHRGADHHVLRRDGGGALALADALGVILQAAQQCAAHAGFMGAAIGRGYGVAVGGQESVGVGGPCDGPFACAVCAVAAGFAGEDVGMHQRVGMDRGGEIILETTGEVKRRFRRNIVDALEQFRRAVPADFDAAEQIGLRARHLEQALRFERGLGAENFGVRLEADGGAAAVVDLAEVLELALGMAALERHLVELLAARDLDLEQRGEGVDHGDADAVQAARGLVNLGVELAAGMQRAHDDFKRGLLREFRMRIDRDAAAVVGDGEEAVGRQFDADERRMSRQRLVHGVVDHLGEQVMQRLLVGAADVHAGAAADRLKSLQHLDVGGGIAGFGSGGPAGCANGRARFRFGGCEKIVGRFRFIVRFQ